MLSNVVLTVENHSSRSEMLDDPLGAVNRLAGVVRINRDVGSDASRFSVKNSRASCEACPASPYKLAALSWKGSWPPGGAEGITPRAKECCTLRSGTVPRTTGAAVTRSKAGPDGSPINCNDTAQWMEYMYMYVNGKKNRCKK